MVGTHKSKSATIQSSNANFNRFLKPGALAKLRDSRINTAAKVYVSSQICNESEGARVEQLVHIDECFLSTMRTFGPQILQRKKLVARKSAFVVASVSESGTERQMIAADVAAH